MVKTKPRVGGLIGLSGASSRPQDDEGGRVETIGALLALLQPRTRLHAQERSCPRVSPPSPNRFCDRFSGELKRGARRALAYACVAQTRAVHVNSRGMASSVQSLYMAELQKVASRTDDGVRSKPKNRSLRRVFAAASPLGETFSIWGG